MDEDDLVRELGFRVVKRTSGGFQIRHVNEELKVTRVENNYSASLWALWQRALNPLPETE